MKEEAVNPPLSVSVVICCYNSAALLPQTLQYLSCQDIEPRSWVELLVVNNCSTDNTEEAARSQWEKSSAIPLRIVREAHLGAGFARFRALNEARGDLIVFVDDDVFLAPDYLRRVSQIMTQERKACALGGLNNPAFEKDPPPWFGEVALSYALGPQGKKAGSVPFLYGAGMVVRREAWRQVLERTGMKSFLCAGRKGAKVAGAGEDYEICIALRHTGWNIHYAPELKAQHYMQAKRLTWDYYCELNRGFGQANVHIDCYRFVHEKITCRKAAMQRTWWGAAWITLQELTKLWMTPPAGFDKEKKRKDCKQIFYLKGRLQELLRLRGRYEQSIYRLRDYFNPGSELAAGSPEVCGPSGAGQLCGKTNEEVL